MLETSVADIAFDIVENTNRNIFLTGEAGTGKTTFLKRVLQKTDKNCVVVAPTGVASINAGGSTIHSMFGLPTRMFLPTLEPVDPNNAQNITMIREHFHYPKPKLDIFKRLDLLIIDEISMVRCDLFDAIDESLRFSRRNNLPFGGVQILLIGDLFQLPPVVRNHEKESLFQYYKSEFFFDSRIYQELNILQLKLDKVYRQTNREFISLLNNIRNAELDESDFLLLQERFQPNFEPNEDGYVTLCSHNSVADEINQRKLDELSTEPLKYHAEIRGDFYESQYPMEESLTLKLGAQVMFIKNDISGEKKYYNGKIGVVSELSTDKIIVEDSEKGNLIEVERVDWQNLKYEYDEITDSVSQEEVGSFKHFPLKLAWAITIHKSQGLTLDKVIIDAGRSFAPGQVYVALSRATSLHGMYLKSGITGRNIFLDPRIVEYSQQNAPIRELPRILESEKRKFGHQRLLQKFEFDHLRSFISGWWNRLLRKNDKIPEDITNLNESIFQVVHELELIMGKFRKEINLLFEEYPDDNDLSIKLVERGSKAIEFSVNNLDNNAISPLSNVLAKYQKRARTKKWQKAMNELLDAVNSKRGSLQKIQFLNNSLCLNTTNSPSSTILDKVNDATDSKLITLNVLKETSNNIDLTAKKRGLVTSTIESHIVALIQDKKLSLQDFIQNKIIEEMEVEITDTSIPLSELKSNLNNKYSYFQLKLFRLSKTIKNA
ncbi:MAG: helix-turn-helix domain-containing protein [Bacteroidia bacterium]